MKGLCVLFVEMRGRTVWRRKTTQCLPYSALLDDELGSDLLIATDNNIKRAGIECGEAEEGFVVPSGLCGASSLEDLRIRDRERWARRASAVIKCSNLGSRNHLDQ